MTHTLPFYKGSTEELTMELQELLKELEQTNPRAARAARLAMATDGTRTERFEMRVSPGGKLKLKEMALAKGMSAADLIISTFGLDV
jgi:hypothetical protein